MRRAKKEVETVEWKQCPGSNRPKKRAIGKRIYSMYNMNVLSSKTGCGKSECIACSNLKVQLRTKRTELSSNFPPESGSKRRRRAIRFQLKRINHMLRPSWALAVIVSIKHEYREGCDERTERRDDNHSNTKVLPTFASYWLAISHRLDVFSSSWEERKRRKSKKKKHRKRSKNKAKFCSACTYDRHDGNLFFRCQMMSCFIKCACVLRTSDRVSDTWDRDRVRVEQCSRRELSV